MTNQETPRERLAYLRTQIDAECISMSEIMELQDLASHIDPGDVVLLEWAGVPEFPESYCPVCGEQTDYCQGHGEIGDPTGYIILRAHDNGDHSRCHPACEDKEGTES